MTRADRAERERRQIDLANILLLETLKQLGVDVAPIVDRLIDEYQLMPSMRQVIRNQ